MHSAVRLPTTGQPPSGSAPPRPGPVERFARRLRPWPLLGVLAPSMLLALALLSTPRSSAARPAGTNGAAATAAPSPEAGVGPTVAHSHLSDGGMDGAADLVPAEVRRLEQLASSVRALLAGELDVAVEPASLFDVVLDDPQAIAIERARLQLLLEAFDACLRGLTADGGSFAIAACGRQVAVQASPTASAPADAGEGDAGAAAAGIDPLPTPDEARWKARIEVDRARLAFYALSAVERAQRLEQHAERQTAGDEADDNRQLSEAERKGKEAAAEREKALEAMRKARTEAARLIAEERARLLGLKERHAEIEGELIRQEQAVRNRGEQILVWRRRVAELVDERAATGRVDAAAAGRLYAAVDEALREARAKLALTLDQVRGDASEVPATGPDALAELAVDVDRQGVDEIRTQIERLERQNRERETTVRWGRAEVRMTELSALNAHRLALLPMLPAERRAAITGFGADGRTVALAEGWQVWLVLQYHFVATTKWVREVTVGGQHRGSAFTATIVALKWLLPIGVFVWWRRRAPRWLTAWRERAKEEARTRPRSHTGERPLGPKVADFMARIRKPIEWLVLVWAVIALLPVGAQALLEVQLFWTVAAWTLGGMVVVDVIDAVFSVGEHPRASALHTAHLRLRSLRWLGRTVVVFGLLLALTSDLVGEGTIYGWVWSTCWWAALPVGLLFVRWWRPVIFERIGLVRRKGPVASWVEARQDGWASFPGAVVGGAYLLGSGAFRRLRSFVGRFEATRRALAYLFRRQLAKQAERRAEGGQSERQTEPLDEETFAAFSPAKPSTELVPSVADRQVDDIIERIRLPGGGVFALVGERGGGKSTLLARIADQTDDTSLVRCPTSGIVDFDDALREVLGLSDDEQLETMGAWLDKRGGDNAVLVDDAHRLIRPVIGGLDDFDRLLELARQSSSSCTWVFAVDAVIWEYFELARESRPLFDDVIRLKPWSEEGIVRLLESRSARADVTPRFDDLVAELPEDADHIDREEARVRTRDNYFRLLWDYASGNPGVALHFWRRSLRVADEQEFVQLFSAPDTSDLERLPDSTVFVLRAVVQLEWARPEDVVIATMLDRAAVDHALRYALARGYIEVDGERYRVRWDWFRAITRFLQRRHLLVARKG